MSLPSVMITSQKATQSRCLILPSPYPTRPDDPRRKRPERHDDTATGASFAFSLNETGSTFKCSLDGAPFYGQRQASAGVRDYLQLERGDGCFSATGWEQGSSGPPFVSRNLLRRSTCRDHPGRGEGSSRRSAYRLPPWLLNSVP